MFENPDTKEEMYNEHVATECIAHYDKCLQYCQDHCLQIRQKAAACCWTGYKYITFVPTWRQSTLIIE